MTPMNHAASWGTDPARTRGWFGRNRALTIALACLALPLMGLLFVGGVLAVAGVALRASAPYQLALTRAEHDPSLIAELGAPIHPGWLTTGEVKVVGSEGEASLAIPISGPHGSGKIGVRASKSAGTWRFSQLQAVVDGRPTPVDLLATP